MSLTGLDDQKVREAHEAATTEPGGWFLLKYVSRDEIDLHGKGTGGIVEMRNSISQYEDASPLFGFLRYRRRNVIIKYMPEDCSRLIQARATVHFNAVCEGLAPYNTTFEIANAKDLKDAKLSAACSLHAASGSTSSSTSSLRRRRLIEIAEEEEEEQRERKRQSTVKEEDRPSTSEGLLHDSAPLPPPIALNADLAASPEEARFAGTGGPPTFSGVPRPPSPAKSLGAPLRPSSEIARPDLHSSLSYNLKPKVKLGPRPSLDMAGRPRTSGGYRPISSIPAGFRMFSKGSKKGSSKNPDKISGIDDSQIKEDDAESAYADPSVPSPDSLATDTTITRPHTSGGSSTNIDASSIMPALASTPTKRNTMTPEKMRLMKAMKLREKNKQAKEEVPQQQEVIPTVDITEIPVTPSESHFIEEASDDHDTSEMLGTSDNGSLSQFSMSKADSAIDVASSPAPDFASVDTQLESHPPSPMPMSPDIGHSTKASSVSGSTDGTVQELLEDKSFEEKSVEERGFEERLDNLDFKNEDAGFPNAKDTYEDADQLDDSRNGHEEEVDKVSEQMLGAASDRRATEITGNFSTEEVVVHEQPAPLAPRSRFAALPSQPMPQAQPDLHVSPGVNESVPGPALPSTQELRIPTSRFATRDSDTASALPVPIIIAPTAEVAPGDTDGSDNVPRLRRKAVIEPIRTDLNNPSDVEAVRADANLSDDEDLMDELQSATLEQAKPMTVSKSPITSVFPTSSPPKSTRSHTAPPRIVRTASNPIRGPLLVPGDVTASSARAVSTGAAFLHKITQQPSANLTPKKTNIGSSISQRIKALEQLHTTSGPATEGPTRTDRPSSTFFSVRKTIAREPSRSPSVIERASSLSRNQTPSPPQSRDASPETAKLALRDRSGSMASRLSIFEGGNAPRGRPESIQVTARIVREPGQMFPKYQEPSADSTDLTPLDLKQSPLVVDHKRAAGTVPVPTVVKTQETSKQASIPNRTTSEEKRRSQSEDRMAQDMDDGESQLRPRRRSSLTIVRDFIKDRRGSLRGGKSPSTDNLGLGSPLALISPSKSLSRPPSVHTTTGFGRRLSISSRRSSLSKDRDLSAPTPPMPMSPSLMTEAGGSGDESKSPPPGEAGQKKSSRTSRFMRRLSSSLVAGRKNSTPTISPTLAEVEDEAELSDMLPSSRGASASGPVVVSYMGDVNVQFPDNLLWKRRAMCLDSHGFLILNAAQGVTASSASVSGREKQAGAIKRYHLSDFRMPYAPEIEVQELPNSVCLDFVDGSGLQIACEDRAGQLNVLHILQEAHQSHTSFGQ